MIMRTLAKTGNNKTRAAELLQISLKTMHNKLNLYRQQGLIPDDRARDERRTDESMPRRRATDPYPRRRVEDQSHSELAEEQARKE